ncbi:MAG: translation initiation factor IF-2 N-terminal domain-containing protein, partial [Syntrophomonas sp.]|nr:translation initiation factor IF-2 N-terminal domain-containing protein [Syntrophomonas sp.]
MAKIRVHELAKELGIPSKQMVETLGNLGLEVKNHMSTMEESQVAWVRKRLGYEPETVPEKTPVKPTAKPTQAPQRPPTRERGEARPETAAPAQPVPPGVKQAP